MKTYRSEFARALIGAIAITVIAAPSVGAAVVTWDASGDSTWSGPSDATSWSGATYNDGDDAEFLGAGTGTVTITGTVNPLSVTVNSAAAADYT
ncbi:MAG: hypothetical protein HKN82_08895, partial [Akkermansiaceae bacterium]|nr:hypothetical protein [Akkermansiaceae bacterium]